MTKIYRYRLAGVIFCLLLLSRSQDVQAQRGWRAGKLVRTTSGDTIQGWLRMPAGGLKFQPSAGGPVQPISWSEIKSWQTAQGEQYLPAPAYLPSPAGNVIEVVKGKLGLYRLGTGEEARLYLVSDSGRTVVPLHPKNYRQQLIGQLTGCAALPLDSTYFQQHRYRYNADELAKLVVQYDQCQWPALPVRYQPLRTLLQVRWGARVGVQLTEMSFIKVPATYFNPAFKSTVSPVATLTGLFIIDNLFSVQAELGYQSWEGTGTQAVNSGDPRFTREATAHLRADAIQGALLVRLQTGVPVAGHWRPLFLVGPTLGHIFHEEGQITYVNIPSGYVSTTPESLHTGLLSSGFVVGIGVERLVGQLHPTVELRAGNSYYNTEGLISRPVRASYAQLVGSISF